MQQVFVSRKLTRAQFVRSSLEMEGIECFMKNEYQAAGAGGRPLAEFEWPEVWIHDDSELEAAKLIVARAQAAFEASDSSAPSGFRISNGFWIAFLVLVGLVILINLLL